MGLGIKGPITLGGPTHVVHAQFERYRKPDRDLSPWKFAYIVGMCLLGAMTVDKIVNGADLDPKQKLGQHLFHDKRVSSDRTTACSSCHSSDHAGSDGRKLAVGRIGGPGSPNGIVGPRKTPTVINASNVKYLDVREQFLDHRARNPLDQAIMPMSNPAEMGNQSAQDVVNRLNRIAGYRALSQRAFGSDLTPDIMRAAIVSYENTLHAIDTPLARYLKGDKEALSESEAHGAELMRKAQCFECHRPPLFTTGRCANNGYAFLSDGDVGLQKTTGNPEHFRAIKIPSLVGVGQRAPYMHNGEFSNLTLVVRHYRAGAEYGPNGRDRRCDARIKKQTWSDADVSDIVATLKFSTVAFDMPDLSPPKEPLR